MKANAFRRRAAFGQQKQMEGEWKAAGPSWLHGYHAATPARSSVAGDCAVNMKRRPSVAWHRASLPVRIPACRRPLVESDNN